MEKEVFGLDLDSAKFLEKSEEAKKAFQSIADIEKFEKLKSVILEYGPILGVAAAAALAFKISFDAAMEAEKIEKINKQFEILAENAGIAGQEMKEKLISSLDGLVDETKGLEAANKAIVTLGTNADRIPEIMNVARKVTKAFGGDMIENFEKMNLSISSGQTRMLRQIGIFIDATTATQKYADVLKIPVALLSEEAKQRAILNSILEYSEKRLKGVGDQNDELMTSTQKLGVAYDELKESLAKLFSFFAPAFQKVIDITKNSIEWFNHFVSKETTEDKINRLNEVKLKIIELGDNMEKVKKGGFWDRIFLGGEKRIQEQIDYYKGLQAQIEKTIPKEKAEEVKKEAVKKSEIDPTKEKEQRRKLNEEIEKMAIEHNNKLIAQEEDYDKLRELYNNRRILMEKQNKIEIEKIKSEYTPDQANQLELSKKQELKDNLVLLEEDYNKRVKELQDQRMSNNETEFEKRRRLLEAEERNAKTNAKHFSAGFHRAAFDATKDMTVFKNAGQNAFNAFQSNATSALQAFGEGSKTASEAAKAFILGSLADIAMMTGQFMMLHAFSTYPVVKLPELAAGAGLIVLSGAIKALAGSGGSGASGGVPSEVSGGGGGGYSLNQTTSAGSEVSTPTQTGPQKTVTLNIHGSYFDTDQTRVKLMELIRSSGDVDDFRNVAVKQ